MAERVLSVPEEELMRMKAVIMDQDKDEAFLLIKEYLRRLEQQQQRGVKSHLNR